MPTKQDKSSGFSSRCLRELFPSRLGSGYPGPRHKPQALRSVVGFYYRLQFSVSFLQVPPPTGGPKIRYMTPPLGNAIVFVFANPRTPVHPFHSDRATRWKRRWTFHCMADDVDDQNSLLIDWFEQSTFQGMVYKLGSIARHLRTRRLQSPNLISIKTHMTRSAFKMDAQGRLVLLPLSPQNCGTEGIAFG